LKQIALLAMSHLASQHENNEELLTLRHTFRTIDLDGDGQVSFKELSACLRERGVEVDEDFQRVYNICDINANGILNFVEFIACAFPPSLVDEKLCTESFLLLDRDYSGDLRATDLHSLCKSLTFEEHAYEEMIREAERTIYGDSCSYKGFLSFDEFHRFIRGDAAV